LISVKILRSAAVAVILICCSCYYAYSQGSTNKGTEFWTAWMDHSNPPTDKDEPSQMDLYITSDVSTSGTVAFTNGASSMPFTVAANQITILTMPASAFLGTQGQFTNAIHITSLKPVAIYAHIFADDASGATLLLPVNTLGKDYYSINYTQTANEIAYSAFIVIATEDNTTVEITPQTPLQDGTPAGVPFTVTLNAGQVYQGLANNDLTGTRIQSVSSGTNTCKKIAVFSGSSRIAIDCNATDNSSDNLFQQVYPTAAWGKNYITVPLKNRDYDIFRVVLSDPTTKLMVNGQLIAQSQFQSPIYYEFNATKPNIITADKPIQVVQYAVSEGNTLPVNGTACANDPEDIGDPEMIYLTPLEQTLDHVTLFSTHNYDIISSYINVLINTSAVSSFMLDGSPYNQFLPVPDSTNYSYAQISVSTGTHYISAAAGFNAIAYGFGVHESYGYAAGANLQDLNEFIALENPQTTTVQNNGCTGIKYNLQLSLPYKTTQIQWVFQDGTPTYTDNNPVAISSSVKNGQTVYVYAYPKNPVSYTSGSYTILATVVNPTADDCGSSETVEFDYTISDPPNAKFAIDMPCLGDSTRFIDQTTSANTIKSWQWNFGDGQTSALQNPVHEYLNPGNYTVSLNVTDVDSCNSVFSVPDLHIGVKPVALFKAPITGCIGQSIAFTDQSTSADGAIVSWTWDFGDGTKDTLTSSTTPLTHTYANTGIDTVKLFVTNVNGCSSLVFEQVETINTIPVVNFSLPDVCLADAYAQFTDSTTIADNTHNTQSDFTYLWNFGDPNASAATNTSTLKNPQHKYTQAANYNVTLTVTSKYGCSVSKTQPFTVNGDNPIAAFAVENNGDLCSSDSVTFDDRSSVDFGNITKIIWYFDYNNNPTDSVVYTRENMPADKKYHHNYGLFNTGDTKNYAVKMVAFSGQTCYNSTDPVTITIKSNPVVTLSQIDSVCVGSTPVQIVENKNGYIGTGVFTGTGVSSTGLFNPAVTGLGSFTINYMFTAQNGCSYSTSEQVNVIPVPTVSVDSSFTVLQGSQVIIDAKASGNGLSYKWTPSLGLDHDDVLKPAASPANDTRYTLTVTGIDGCSTTVTVDVNVLKDLIIPNTFTPNGDGVNDTWNIQYIDEYPHCTVDIFDRYGQKVYTSIGYPTPWDGRYKGANLPTGTYYYIINPKSGRKQVSGYVAIIR